MADNTGGGATPLLTFLVGGLIVAVAALGFFMYSNSGTSTAPATAGPTTIITRPVIVKEQPAQHHWWQWRKDSHDRDHHDAPPHN